jgi:hypothetical protein
MKKIIITGSMFFVFTIIALAEISDKSFVAICTSECKSLKLNECDSIESYRSRYQEASGSCGVNNQLAAEDMRRLGSKLKELCPNAVNN